MSYIIPDPQWEQPALLTPGRKPVGPVKLTVEGSAWLFDESLRNTDGKYPLTIANNVSIGIGIKGKNAVFGSGTSSASNTAYSDGPMYGLVLHYDQRIKVNDGTDQSLQVIDILGSAGRGLNYNASTGFLTGETVALVTIDDDGRDGTDESIGLGEHVFALLWDGGNYNFYLDGRAMNMIRNNGGTVLSNWTFSGITVRGCRYSSDPILDMYSLQVFTAPVQATGESLTLNPYQFLIPAG